MPLIDASQTYQMTNPGAHIDATEVSAVHPNLLDNAYFVGGGSQLGGETFPINQRGQTSYTSGGTGIDRWCTDLPSGNGVTLTASGVTLDSGVYWGQHRVAKDLAGETLTLSVMLADGTIYSGTAVYNHEVGVGYTFFGNGLMACYALRLGSSDVAQFEISTYTAITVKAVKLEKGTVSTLANDTIPSFVEELRKCQRFFCSSFPLTIAPEAGNTAEWYASMGTARNNGCYSVWFPVEMYSVPTVIKLGMAYVFAALPDGTENTTYDTSISATNVTTKGFSMKNSFFNGFATFGMTWYASCEP